VSPELCDEIELELEMLRLQLADAKPLIESARKGSPTQVEVMAVAVVLHSFYTGIENLFKRIALHTDRALPQGVAWHIELLKAMASPTPTRPAAISEGLRTVLKAYLDFRHFFRHAYSCTLRWDRMAPLAMACESTFRQIEHEMLVFLQNRPCGS